MLASPSRFVGVARGAGLDARRACCASAATTPRRCGAGWPRSTRNIDAGARAGLRASVHPLLALLSRVLRRRLRQRDHRCRAVHARPLLSVAIVAVGLTVMASTPTPGTPGLPPAVAEQLPEVRIRGGGELTFFGTVDLRARLYRSPGARGDCAPDEPFALSFLYKRRLNGDRIADRSVEEIARLGYGTTEQRARWGAQLRQMLPDVSDGDRLTGVNVPRRGGAFLPQRRSRSAPSTIPSSRARFSPSGSIRGPPSPHCASGCSGKAREPPAAPRTQIEARSAQVRTERTAGLASTHRCRRRLCWPTACSACRSRWPRCRCTCTCRSSTATISVSTRRCSAAAARAAPRRRDDRSRCSARGATAAARASAGSRSRRRSSRSAWSRCSCRPACAKAAAPLARRRAGARLFRVQPRHDQPPRLGRRAVVRSGRAHAHHRGARGTGARWVS